MTNEPKAKPDDSGGHVHFNATQCSKEKFVQVMRDAHSVCLRWWFDELDCHKSIYRQRVEGISFEDALSHFTEDAVPIVVERRGGFLDDPYSEIGFHTLCSPGRFLWIINDTGYAAALGFPLRKYA